ncbi:MAG: AraC family transcriptional regulator N-terminal domain-containing protein [Sandaracinaceae bacterium]
MTCSALARDVERYARDIEKSGPRVDSGELVPGLAYIRRTEPTRFEAFVYEPLMCLILQGQKETSVGERRVRTRPGECIVVSHDLPVVSRITEASPAAPYLALVARLDLSELRTLADEVGQGAPSDDSGAHAVAAVDETLLDVVRRYVALAADPGAVPVLAPLVRRELHFRLLTATHGAMLRRLLHRDSHASKIARAIARLRRDYRQRLEVPALARSVGMSSSSFHKHFKAVTATTPLQYQKDLRLTEAQRLLRAGDHSVSTAAYEVGYESATQFSREYARRFGVPPREHLRRGPVAAGMVG